MKSVFLDFATLDNDDLETTKLELAAPGLAILPSTRQDDVLERIAGCDIVMTNKLRLDRTIVEGSPALRLIAISATGTNNLDLDAARERGVAVCNVTDYCTPSVVQHVLGVLLSLTHRLDDYSREARDGTWARGSQFTLLGHPTRT